MNKKVIDLWCLNWLKAFILIIISVRVHLWDLSGSPEYIDVRNELYGQTDAVFLVFDVTNQASFDSLDTWMKEINKYSGGVQEVVLVANKVHGLPYKLHISHYRTSRVLCSPKEKKSQICKSVWS